MPDVDIAVGFDEPAGRGRPGLGSAMLPRLRSLYTQRWYSCARLPSWARRLTVAGLAQHEGAPVLFKLMGGSFLGFLYQNGISGVIELGAARSSGS